MCFGQTETACCPSVDILINHYILVQFQSINLFDGKNICLLVNMLCMHNSSYTQ